MGKVRTEEELQIYEGAYRVFEWYWRADGLMPALDAFEGLSPEDRAGIMASFEHWGSLKPGEFPSPTRVNLEHDDPLVLAIKAKKHRFIGFHAEGTRYWVIAAYYVKQTEKLDKRGRAVIRRTLLAREDFNSRVKDGTYYERG